MKVLLYVNRKKDPELANTLKIAGYMESIGIQSFVFDESAKCSDKWDFVISVGGDGTFLQAAKIAYKNDVPMIGINLGRLGFMPSLEVNDLSKLKRLLKGDFEVEERALLDVNVCTGENTVFRGICLNDAILKMNNAHTLDLQLCCNGQSVNTYRADGIVISTPTGSSAYSLSCGGPIVSPAVECILATPICAHTFSSRPIIFDLDAKIDLSLCETTEYDVYLSLDGTESYKISHGDKVKISVSDKKLKVLRLDDMSYYELLSKKLDF